MHAFNDGTWDEGTRLYFGHVERFWAKKSTSWLADLRPLHAVYLLHKLLQNAQREMRIFSGSLPRHVRDGKDRGMAVYAEPKILEAAKGFLSKEDTCLKIVVEKELDVDEGQSVEDHPLMQMVGSLKDEGRLRGSCEIRKASPEQIRKLEEIDVHCHMMLMDKSAYWLKLYPDKVEACGHFNDDDLRAGAV